MSKNDDRHGTFEKDLQRCIFPGMRTNGGYSNFGEVCGHQVKEIYQINIY